MIIDSFSGRALGVALPPYLVEALPSGRLRRLVLPVAALGHLAAGDAMWVREGIIVAPRQRRRDQLVLSYAGQKHRTIVSWLAGSDRPGAGHLPAGSMPVAASRYTLLIESVERRRLGQLGEAQAIEAGATIEIDGFGCLGHPFLSEFDTPCEALAFLFDQLHPGRGQNPEVLSVAFRSYSRNVGALLDRWCEVPA